MSPRQVLGLVAPGVEPSGLLASTCDLPNGLRVSADAFGWVSVEARTAAGWTSLVEGDHNDVRAWLIARLRDQAAALGVALDVAAKEAA